MSLRNVVRLCLPLAALALVLSQSQALAVPIVFDSAANTQPPFHNPGSPPVDVNSFDTDITLLNTSTLFVQGSFAFDIHMSANLGITGATANPTATITIPAQSIPIYSNSQHISTTPTGSGQLTLWDEQVSGYDPGGDGSNPNPGAKLPSTLSRADLTGFNVSLINGGGATVQSNQITINGSGSMDTGILGITLPVTVALVGQATAGLTALDFNQTSGDALVGNGTPNLLAPGANATRTYPLNLNNYGDLNGTGAITVGGIANLDIGGLFTTSFNLGNLVNQTLNLSSAFPLPGTAKLADLNPTGYDAVNKDDLQATIGFDGSGLGLPFALASTGTALLTTTTTLTTNLAGAPITITANVTGTITFGVNARLEVDNLVYQLQDSVASVVAPEPGSVVLMFVGLVAALPLVVRRLRRRS